MMKNGPVAQADINGVHVKVYPANQFEYPPGWTPKPRSNRMVAMVLTTGT